jgi:hypothetical protein
MIIRVLGGMFIVMLVAVISVLLSSIIYPLIPNLWGFLRDLATVVIGVAFGMGLMTLIIRYVITHDAYFNEEKLK